MELGEGRTRELGEWKRRFGHKQVFHLLVSSIPSILVSLCGGSGVVVIATWCSSGPKSVLKPMLGALLGEMEMRPGPVLGSPILGDRGAAHNLYEVHLTSVATAAGLQRRKGSTLVAAWRRGQEERALKVGFQQLLGRGLGGAGTPPKKMWGKAWRQALYDAVIGGGGEG